MARSSSIVTISLPPKMVVWSGKVAKRQQMTRSELVRTALRKYLEEQVALDAIRVFDDERKKGKLKKLISLAHLMR